MTTEAQICAICEIRGYISLRNQRNPRLISFVPLCSLSTVLARILFGRLQNGGLYLRHPVDAGGAFADVHIEKRPAKVHQSRLKLCDLCALGGNKNNCVNQCESVSKKSVHQRNQRLNFLRALGSLWLYIQSKIINYAKQTQFPKCPDGCKLSKDNNL